MTICLNTIKRVLKEKMNIIFMFVMPAVFIIIMMMLNDSILLVGVSIKDEGKFSKMLIDDIKKRANVVYIENEDIKPNIIEGAYDCIIQIDEGFSEDIISGKNPKIKIYSIKESNTSENIKIFINSYLNSAKNIASACSNDSNKFYRCFDEYRNSKSIAEYISLKAKGENAGKVIRSIGFALMGILYFLSFAVIIIMRDKRNKTYYRIFTAPVTMKKYMLENILSFFTLAVIQILILLYLINILGGNLGKSFLDYFVILLLFSLFSISFGTYITTISKDVRQAQSITSLVITPVLMLGGCYWPIEIMPKFLQRLSNFLPTTWCMRACEKIAYGATLRDLYVEISILLLFSVVFFLLSTWKKTDIAK